MNRETFVTKVQDLIYQAYLHDPNNKYYIDSKYYKDLIHEAEKLRHLITLAEFLGWEEGVEYKRKGSILKVEGNHLLNQRSDGKFYNTICSTDELIDLRNATKYVQKYYARIKGWELFADFVGTKYWGPVSNYGRVGVVNVDGAIDMTKDKWASVGINENNADFVLVGEVEND